MTVRNILQQKGRNVWTIDPEALVLEALAKMAEKDVGSLVVTDCEKFVGIITERHYLRSSTHCTRDRINACDPVPEAPRNRF